MYRKTILLNYVPGNWEKKNQTKLSQQIFFADYVSPLGALKIYGPFFARNKSAAMNVRNWLALNWICAHIIQVIVNMNFTAVFCFQLLVYPLVFCINDKF